MRRIYKYPLEITDVQEIQLPIGAEILTVQNQRNTLCLWAIVDPDAKLESRTIRVHRTGHKVPNDEILKYIGTAQTHQDNLVWHVFEEVPE